MSAARKRVDPFAQAAAKRGAAELVAGWTVERLLEPNAGLQLARSWGLELAIAQQLVTAERSRRRV
jgi:hypothetical protein